MLKKHAKMPDHLGDDMRKVKADEKEEEIKCLYFVLFLLFSFRVCFNWNSME